VAPLVSAKLMLAPLLLLPLLNVEEPPIAAPTPALLYALLMLTALD